MRDVYRQFANSPIGKQVVSRAGLPRPLSLRRYRAGQPLLTAPALLGGSGRLAKTVREILTGAGTEVHTAPDEQTRYGALIFDASAAQSPGDLAELYEFFHPVIRRIAPGGRILVLGAPPEDADSPGARVAQRALEGFTRSAGKEIGKGGTAQLVYVADGAESAVESTVRFLLSARSAYVSGQVVRVHAADAPAPQDWELPLTGTVALVTGASRGIGAAIADVLGRDGAHVVCLDIPAQGADLSTVANRVRGSALQCDITADNAPEVIAEHLAARHGRVDVVVHNAGITRDKTLGKMDAARWDSVIAVNLNAALRINDTLIERDVLARNGRIVGVSSIAGIAGNFGQTNYGTSKAGVIGMVDAYAPVLAERGGTINAVAPGFIETAMTDAMPLFTREAGRRMNSMAQGGLPVDVAEAVGWYASPASVGVNGNVVRVCGQSLLGA